MSSGRKCKNCGSSDIEVDPARGDAVCTNCGSVLEDSIIVAEVQFEEGAHGSSSAIGQFVSSDSKGGATKFGPSFHVGGGVESREITLRKARCGITRLCNQLKLNQQCIDTAVNFFKMALSRDLTKGRRNSHVNAACVYLTCRTEGTAHLLIDISDVLQICCYKLGRTYLKLSQALCITVPSPDPCLYIMRFAAQLEFGPKMQQVANTALRVVQRMKRDSIHLGRRPSSLCGAALLIAARLHEFNRSIGDIIKIVKVHESTLRKRLLEFGDTPSSELTLEEFMTIDLEEEQDPPSFKMARIKDKERLQKLMDEEFNNFSDLKKKIETALEKDPKKKKKLKLTEDGIDEETETNEFIEEATLGAIQEFIEQEQIEAPRTGSLKELGPDVASMGLAASLSDTSNVCHSKVFETELDNFDDLDDNELDAYIMSEHESERKKDLWFQRNSVFLEEQKAKADKLQKEREEGKPEKKRKRTQRKRNMGPANSAGEAIEKIIQEKKISSKINYDVLKTLIAGPSSQNENVPQKQEEEASTKQKNPSSVPNNSKQRKKKLNNSVGLPVFENGDAISTESKKEEIQPTMSEEENEEEYYDDDQLVSEMGVLQMLKQHRERDDQEMESYDYGEYEDYD